MVLTELQWKKLHKELEVVTIPMALENIGLSKLDSRQVRNLFVERFGKRTLGDLIRGRAEKRNILEMPPLHYQVKNLARSTRNNLIGGIQTGKIKASEEIQNKRFLECVVCPNYSKEKGRCSACGCFVKTKIKLLHERCPKDKW